MTIRPGNEIARALGNSIASGWHFDYQRLAIRLPAAGNSITSGWHFECPRVALRVPAAGTSFARGWHFYSQGLGI